MRTRVVLVIVIAFLAALPLFPHAHATNTLQPVNHYYSGTQANACLNVDQSGLQGSNGIQYALGFINVGHYTTRANTQATSCTGYASLSAYAEVDGDWISADSSANVTFIDSLTIPNNGQQYSNVTFTGQYYLYGWQGAFASGTISQAYSADQLSITDRIVSSSGVVVNPGWVENPSITAGTQYNQPCNGAVLQWPPAPFYCDVTPQKIYGQNEFSHESEPMTPGTYNFVLSFVATAHADMQ